MGTAECSCQVVVESPLSPNEGPPHFSRPLHHQTILDGDPLRMGVSLKGSPPMKVQWVKDDTLLEHSPRLKMRDSLSNEGHSHWLEFDEVRPEDSGVYFCEATNEVGESYSSCRVRVLDPHLGPPAPPCIIGALNPLHIKAGTGARFRAAIRGHPVPSVIWQLDGQTVVPSERIKISCSETEEGLKVSLSVSDVRVEDCGTISLIAVNALGKQTVYTNLQIIPLSDKDRRRKLLRRDTISTRQKLEKKSVSVERRPSNGVQHSSSSKSLPSRSLSPSTRSRPPIKTRVTKSISLTTANIKKSGTRASAVSGTAPSSSKSISPRPESRSDISSVPSTPRCLSPRLTYQFKSTSTSPLRDFTLKSRSPSPASSVNSRKLTNVTGEEKGKTVNSSSPSNSSSNKNITKSNKCKVPEASNTKTTFARSESPLRRNLKNNCKEQVKSAERLKPSNDLKGQKLSATKVKAKELTTTTLVSTTKASSISSRNASTKQKLQVSKSVSNSSTRNKPNSLVSTKVSNPPRLVKPKSSHPTSSTNNKPAQAKIASSSPIHTKTNPQVRRTSSNPPQVKKSSQIRRTSSNPPNSKPVPPALRASDRKPTTQTNQPSRISCDSSSSKRSKLSISRTSSLKTETRSTQLRKEVKRTSSLRSTVSSIEQPSIPEESSLVNQSEAEKTDRNLSSQRKVSRSHSIPKSGRPSSSDSNKVDSKDSETTDSKKTATRIKSSRERSVESTSTLSKRKPKLKELSQRSSMDSAYGSGRNSFSSREASHSPGPAKYVPRNAATPIKSFSRGSSQDQILRDDSRYSVCNCDNTSSLTILGVTADDTAKYTAVIRNKLSAHASFASLSVEDVPEQPAAQPNLSEVGAGCVTLSWYGPSYDGGSVVTGYTVETRKVGQVEWTTLVKEWHNTSYKVVGQEVGGQYEYRIRAQNIHGLSQASKTSQPITLEGQNEDETNSDDECDDDSLDEHADFEHTLVTLDSGDLFDETYEIHEEVGKGRFGIVYRCSDKVKSKTRAAKIIKCIKSSEKEKVKEEISIMNSLRNPKLLQLAAAFERQRDVVMVMEYISGGELFERVVRDDFMLTEKDVILFMRQICEGVEYMHSNSILHLDLKPENILCVRKSSHKIKLIDFGLARRFDPENPCRVLFGTPEFIAPEIINYEPISLSSDMWSVGVICYVLLSGLSPFMGDNDAETFANITRAEFDFDDDAFTAISEGAKGFISALLVNRKEKRLTATECLHHNWLAQTETTMDKRVIPTDKLKKFIIRRKWQEQSPRSRLRG